MRVLLAVDGSESSEAARALVASLPLTAADSIRIVTVYSDSITLYGAHWAVVAIDDPDRLNRELHEASQAIVDDAVGRTKATVACTVEGHVLRGRPASAIVDEAASFRADLVVMGSRGHGPFRAALLGSVSEEVVDHAPCPVLIARGHAVSRILIADDGSAAAAIARNLVARAPFAAFPVHVVSVAVVPPPWQAAMSPMATELALEAFDESLRIQEREHGAIAERAAAELAPGRPSADTEVRLGDPAGEIVAAAGEWGADLIAMGTHGRTGLRRMLLGSVARNVLHHAPCSVLVAREVVAPST